MKSDKSIIIIGAGIGGLATAALLAKAGYPVTVLEKQASVGGRARVFKAKGFSFDMGPSWYMMPEIFENFYQQFDKKSSDFFTLKRLDPLYRIFWGKDDCVNINAKFSENKKYFESREKGSFKKMSKYLTLSSKLYRVTIRSFLYTDFKTLTSWVDLGKAAFSIPFFTFRSIDQVTSRYVTDYRLKQIMSYWSVFLGGSPYLVPGLYSLMSHVEFQEGVYYPMNGMGEVINSLVTLCKTHGVVIQTSSEVTQISKKSDRVTVYVGSKSYTADRVVSNADYQYTQEKLLSVSDRTITKTKWKKKTIAPSMFLMYLGVKGQVKKLGHHNLFLSSDWNRHFDQIFKTPQYPDDPNYYICAPSKSDVSVAPKNHENLFILVPIAAGLSDTSAIRKDYSNKILLHLEKITGQDIIKNIVFKRTYSLNDFKNDYHAFEGTALGLSHSLFQTAFLRPAMQSKKIPQLFFVGQDTLPGVGMPMVLISAQVVAAKIIKGL